MNLTDNAHSRQLPYHTVNPFVVVKGGAEAFISFVETVFDAKENKAVRTPDKDGSLIHAEIQLGDAMLLLADSKPDWLFTPALLQVYVPDAQAVLTKAQTLGATIVTELSPFYNGLQLARMKDRWGNLWWLYEKQTGQQQPADNKSNTDWHSEKPSYVYTTLVEAMQTLQPPETQHQ